MWHCQAVYDVVLQSITSPHAPGMLIFCLQECDPQRKQEILYVYCQVNTLEVESNELGCKFIPQNVLR